MVAYVIAQIRVHDPEGYKNYLAGVGRTLANHKATIVGRSLEPEVLEGEWALPRTVIIRFPTVEDARRWHSDPEYREVAEHRHRAADANLVLIEGAE